VIKTEVYNPESYAEEVARLIQVSLPEEGNVVITGGTTAERVYPVLAEADHDWSRTEIAFSDERCVPPDHPQSNFAMARRLLFEPAAISNVHRMRGELPPNEGARRYHDEIAPLVSDGFDLVLLGMGADAHIAGNFPGSDSLNDSAFCAAVHRPDGMEGLTLTPPALLRGRKVLLIVTGEGKAQTVWRVIHGYESPDTCPARLLANHPDVTMLLDAPAASAL
jgi:6-phosphogluconolactonase